MTMSILILFMLLAVVRASPSGNMSVSTKAAKETDSKGGKGGYGGKGGKGGYGGKGGKGGPNQMVDVSHFAPCKLMC